MAKPKPAGKAPNASDLANLAQAVIARNTGNPLMIQKAAMKTLTELGFIEFNDAGAQGDLVPCRATETGVAYAAENCGPSNPEPAPVNPFGAHAPPTPAETSPATASTTASDFVLENDVTIPPLRRGGRGVAVRRYPFDTMAVHQSFFIPISADNPKPSKRVASVVSTASKSMAPKKFKVQAVVEAAKVTAENPTGGGARVWRLA